MLSSLNSFPWDPLELSLNDHFSLHIKHLWNLLQRNGSWKMLPSKWYLNLLIIIVVVILTSYCFSALLLPVCLIKNDHSCITNAWMFWGVCCRDFRNQTERKHAAAIPLFFFFQLVHLNALAALKIVISIEQIPCSNFQFNTPLFFCL